MDKAVMRIVGLNDDERVVLEIEEEEKRIFCEREEKRFARMEGLEEGRQEGLIEGRQEGLIEGRSSERIAIALKMIECQMDDETISKVTGLSILEIKNLRNSL